jgi:phosphomannomutase/glucose-6-phosphate isomerase
MMTPRVKNSRTNTATKIIFGTSGWRGKIDKDFTLPNVQRAAQGVSEHYNNNIKKGRILIGYDPRGSNKEFAVEIASILAANHVPVDIIIEEPTPTPVLAYLANSSVEITGVINLTASHNKFTDDGFKFSPQHGGAADKKTTDLISQYANEAKTIRRTTYESAKSTGLIREIPLREALEKYVDGYITPTLKGLKAWEAITSYIKSNPKFKLVLDPMQGTSVKYLEALYRKIEIEADRRFIKILHIENKDPLFSAVNGAPNPTEPDNVKELITVVSKDTATLGIATDGDGDRFGIIDFGGKPIQGNDVIAMLTYFLASKNLRGVVGKTVATSNFVEAVAKHSGLEVVETPVGFKWFVEKATEDGINFLIAGEESAHVGTGPFMKSWDDGIALGILCLWMVAETGKSLSSYKEEIETALGRRYFYNRDNVELTSDLRVEATELINRVKEEQSRGTRLEEMLIHKFLTSLHASQRIESIVTIDGLKIIFESGDWLCIRLSGTENVARVYTEVTDPGRRGIIQFISKALLGIRPEAELSNLIQASERPRLEIKETNTYREIGFEDDNSRLGWVIPPTWEKIEAILIKFNDLNVVKRKTNFVFSGMGGSINTIKAIKKIHGNQIGAKIYTIDSLDPAALKELFSYIDSLPQTLVIGISKSGTTRETQDILKAMSQRFESEGLDVRNHFIWLTDLPKGQTSIESSGWVSTQTLPIQVDGGTDIGGRFTAPHTAIFVIPLYLALNRDIVQLRSIWGEYLRLREVLLESPAERAYSLAKKGTQTFAVVLDDPIAQALETWVTQLIQESLGSKNVEFNPKTIVLPTGEAIPPGFEQVRFDFDSLNVDVKTMVNMYLLQIFTAIFAYEKGINFVTQPEVELYKREMNIIDPQKLPNNEPVTPTELVAKIKNHLQLKPKTRFLEVICYWHLNDDFNNLLDKLLKNAFPQLETLVFTGSDWNHHSYQAASKNEDTLFIILTKSDYEHDIDGVSELILENNIRTIQKIAYATHQTLHERALIFKVNEVAFIS